MPFATVANVSTSNLSSSNLTVRFIHSVPPFEFCHIECWGRMKFFDLAGAGLSLNSCSPVLVVQGRVFGENNRTTTTSSASPFQRASAMGVIKNAATGKLENHINPGLRFRI